MIPIVQRTGAATMNPTANRTIPSIIIALLLSPNGPLLVLPIVAGFNLLSTNAATWGQDQTVGCKGRCWLAAGAGWLVKGPLY